MIVCVQMDQINMHNAQMVRHTAEVEGHSALLKGQLQECESQWNKAIADNARLHQQVSLLNSKAHVSIQLFYLLVFLSCRNCPTQASFPYLEVSNRQYTAAHYVAWQYLLVLLSWSEHVSSGH